MTDLSIQQAQEEAQRAIKQGNMFIEQTRTKMKQLVDDFASGKLNREQFHTLYDRYQSQINGVKLLIAENDPTMWINALDGDETLNIRKRLLAKATGMGIYLNKQVGLLNKLGKFNVDGIEVARVMQIFKEKIDKEGSPTEAEMPHLPTQMRYPQMVIETQKYGWFFLAKGQFTTIITVFSKEPTQDQRETMIRLLRDFEIANATHLQKPHVTADDIAMPFKVFVQREAK
ncbi:MAG: hypothetical protein L0154_23130 [Chloroflexi bacterium]|nr:hypothetical protein [Chloroflexota bacterium]